MPENKPGKVVRTVDMVTTRAWCDACEFKAISALEAPKNNTAFHAQMHTWDTGHVTHVAAIAISSYRPDILDADNNPA